MTVFFICYLIPSSHKTAIAKACHSFKTNGQQSLVSPATPSVDKLTVGYILTTPVARVTEAEVPTLSEISASGS